jgi:osmoprotectant transport system permease protein
VARSRGRAVDVGACSSAVLGIPYGQQIIVSGIAINRGVVCSARKAVCSETLGSPIIVGLSGFNTAYVLQGAVLVGLLAVAADMAFERLASRVQWNS